MKTTTQIAGAVLALCGAMYGVAANAASAATDSANLQVTATVLTACAIGPGTLNFGSIKLAVNAGVGTLGTTSDVDADSGTTVKVVCTSGSSAAVTADQGLNYSTGRNMAAGDNRLKYELYTSSARSTLLDSSTGSISVTGSGDESSLTIYGRVFGDSLAKAPAGSYSDTVALTITYTP